MSSKFDDAFVHVVGIEGKYSNDPKDSGGETMYGITLDVARSFGYGGRMQDLPLATAKEIYKRRYWEALNLEVMPTEIAKELFDTGVNLGVAAAGTFLQRCLNALNRQQSDYPDVVVDGVVGPKTIAALNAYLDVRKRLGVRVLLVAMNCLQGEFYISLVERREKDERFLFGWLSNRVALA